MSTGAANGWRTRFRKGYDRRRNYHGRPKGTERCPTCQGTGRVKKVRVKA